MLSKNFVVAPIFFCQFEKHGVAHEFSRKHLNQTDFYVVKIVYDKFNDNFIRIPALFLRKLYFQPFLWRPWKACIHSYLKNLIGITKEWSNLDGKMQKKSSFFHRKMCSWIGIYWVKCYYILYISMECKIYQRNKSTKTLIDHLQKQNQTQKAETKWKNTNTITWNAISNPTTYNSNIIYYIHI